MTVIVESQSFCDVFDRGSKLTIWDVLRAFGHAVPDEATETDCPIPECKQKSPMKIYENGWSFVCSSCGQQGNAINLNQLLCFYPTYSLAETKADILLADKVKVQFAGLNVEPVSVSNGLYRTKGSEGESVYAQVIACGHRDHLSGRQLVTFQASHEGKLVTIVMSKEDFEKEGWEPFPEEE